MIVLTVLFAGNMPQNCKRIMLDIMHLTNLDIINPEDFIKSMFSFKAEPDPINENFEEAGYDTSNFILGLGLLFFVLIASTLLWLFKKLIEYIVKPCEDNCITIRVRSDNLTKVALLRFFNEGCIELSLVSMMAIKMMSEE